MLPVIRTSLRTAGALVVAAVTLEMCARVEDAVRYGAPLWGNYSSESLYYFDANGRHGKPHASYLKWKLNEAGYRGPALRSGTYRVACVGSSETFGYYEPERREWPRQLESELNRFGGGREVEVVNAAYPGMSIGDSLRRLEGMMAAVRPRAVVIYPSYASYIDPPRQTAIPPPERWDSRLMPRLNTLLGGALPDSLRDWIRNAEVQRASRGLKVMARIPESSVQRFADDLHRLVAGIQAQGVQVVLVTHATRFGAKVDDGERGMLIAWRRFYPVLHEDGFLDLEKRMRAAVIRCGARAGVPVVDAATQVRPGPENFADFVHFTDAGARALATLVARQLAPYVIDRGRLRAERPGALDGEPARLTAPGWLRYPVME